MSIAVVQQAHTSGSQTTVVFSAGVTTGSTLVVMCGRAGNTGTLTSVSGCGATWTRVANPATAGVGNDADYEIWVGAGATLGTTLTFGTAGAVTAVELSGVNPSTASTATAVASTATSQPAVSATVPAGAGIVVAGFEQVQTQGAGTFSAGTTNALFQNSNGNDNNQPSWATVTPGASLTYSGVAGGNSFNSWAAAMVFFAALSVGSYSTEVLADSPVAYYPMEETSGTNCTDLGANGSTGQYQSGVTLGNAALFPANTGSMHYNGSGFGAMKPGGVVALNPTSLSGTWSVEVWFSADSLASTTAVFGSRNPSDFSFDVQVSSTQVHGDFGFGGGWDNTTANASFTFATGTAYHLVTVVTPTSVTYYVNGSAIGSPTLAHSDICYDGTHALFFGGNNKDASFTGRMAHGAIYSTALSSTRIVAHHTAAFPVAPTKVPHPLRQSAFRMSVR